MKTVAEIKAAIEGLPYEQVEEIAAWLKDFQMTMDASSTVFSLLDFDEEAK